MIIDPMLEDEQAPPVEPVYDPKRYTDAFARGLTGTALAKAAGVAVPQGFSPPLITPAPAPVLPPQRWDSAANYVRRTPEEEFANEMKNTVSSMPIKQAQEAINAAQQFHAMRIFQGKIKEGVDPAVAAMEVAPLLNKGTAAGLAQMVRARQAAQPKPEKPITVAGEGIFERDPKTGQLKKTMSFDKTTPKPVVASGIGVWEYDEKAGQWKKTESTQKKQTFGARKATVDPETGEITEIAGDPADPEFQKMQEEIRKKKAAKDAEPSVWERAWNKVMGKSGDVAEPPAAAAATPAVTPKAVEAPEEIPVENLIQMAKQAGVALILTKEEFDKFPGGRYLNKNGKIAVKK